MKKAAIFIFTISIMYSFLLLLNSCRKDSFSTGIDKQLYDMAQETSGFTWFSNSSTQLDKSSGSGHSEPFLRTRYNAIATTKLDSTGKIIPGISFPEGSLIVKELYSNSSTLGRYAILYKNEANSDADANGWVWGYINSNGTVAEAAAKKGASCINCHSQTDNIDYMLMNKYYP